MMSNRLRLLVLTQTNPFLGIHINNQLEAIYMYQYTRCIYTINFFFQKLIYIYLLGGKLVYPAMLQISYEINLILVMR